MKYLILAIVLVISLVAKEDLTIGKTIEYSKTANELYAEYLQTNNKDKLENAYEIIDELTSKAPDNLGLQGLYYDIARRYISEFQDKKALKKLEDITEKLYKKGLKTIPIEYFKALVIKKENPKKAIEYLKQVIKKERNYTNAYDELVSIYASQKRYEEAISMLKSSINKVDDKLPLEYDLMLTEFQYYGDLASVDDNVSYIGKEKLYKMINELYNLSKNIHKKLAQEKFSLYVLEDSSYLLGKFNESYQYFLEKKKNNMFEEDEYAYKLLFFYKKEKLEEFIKKNKDAVTPRILYLYHFTKKDWEKSYKYAEEDLKENKDYFYGYWRLALISLQIDKNTTRTKEIINSIPKKAFENSWQKRLKEYFLEKISKKDLLKIANDNIFKLTEAYFIFGMQEMAKGNKELADSYFNKVLELKLYNYVEYTLASFLLNSNKDTK